MNLLEELIKEIILHLLCIGIDELFSIKKEIEDINFLIEADLMYLRKIATPEMVYKFTIETGYLE